NTTKENVEQTQSNIEDVNVLEGVSLQVKESTITQAALTLRFQNETDDSYIFGEAFSLEEEVDGKWVEVALVLEDAYGFEDIGYPLAPKTREEWAVDWEWLYGELSA